MRNVLTGPGSSVITSGLFGGLAIAVLGFRWRTKDVNYLAHTSKERLIYELEKVPNMKVITGQRTDVAQFLYGERDPALMEIFLSTSTRSLLLLADD